MHSRVSRILLSLLAVFILAGSGCGHKQHMFMRDGREYGIISDSFTGDWRNCYERGRSFAEGGFHAEAIADLLRAIAGNEKDQWETAPSGRNRIDYFPHRELGILYYQRKEYDKAIAELECSIDSTPSARAAYFLDKARAARIERYDLDRTPPELYLETTTADEITNRLTKIVKGIASDDNFVASITVGNRRVDTEPAARRKIFSTEESLDEGENRIRVVVTDLAGKSTEQHLTIYSDRKGPRIEIEELSIRNGRMYLQGNVSDDKGLASLSINNERWPITGRAAGYNFKLALPDEKITIVAADLAGNITQAVIREHEAGSEEAGPPFRVEEIISHPANTEELPESDFPALPPPAGSPPAVDVTPPYIRIQKPGPDENTFADTVLLEGMVSDASLLVYISINGESVPNRNGRKVFFSQLKKLSPGPNTFHIIAADEQGNKVYKTIQVHRLIPVIRRIESRMALVVLPFDVTGETSRTGIMFRDRLIDSFIDQGRFRVVEKSEIDSMLREQQWDGALPMNPELAAYIGKKVAAEAVVTGSVIETRGSLEIMGRLIDVATGTILAANDVFGEGTESALPDHLLDQLALRFKRDVPPAEGSLLEVRGNEVLIDAGTDKKIKPAMQFICYREGPPASHPVTGQSIAPEPQILAILKVEEVEGDFCRASILEQYSGLMVSDRVIAR